MPPVFYINSSTRDGGGIPKNKKSTGIYTLIKPTLDEPFKVWGKKTGHLLCSVAHQISILELKLIKRGPNKMS